MIVNHHWHGPRKELLGIKQPIYTQLKKRDLLFSFEESTERMYVTKIKQRIKEVKTEENKETNLKIDLEVEARNKPFRSNSSQNSPGRAHIR